MVMFRITTTNKTKKKENDQARLLKAKPTFLVYFPGEPYFYANSNAPKEDHCEALMMALKCTAFEGIPLHGRHLESLRQLRSHRDEPEIIEHDLWQDDNENMPILNHFSVSAVNSIRDDQKTLMENVTATIELKGNDVLNSLRNLASNSDIIMDPLPPWVTKAVYRGRNHVNIKPRILASSPSKLNRSRNLDEMSIAGSDLTVLNLNRVRN